MGVSAGDPETELSAEDIKMPPWSEKALWEKKFRVWSALIEKGCIAKRGQGGRFCGLGGHACFYVACPRRTFEEVSTFIDELAQPEPSPDFVKQFNESQAQIARLQKQLNNTKKRVDGLEKKNTG